MTTLNQAMSKWAVLLLATAGCSGGGGGGADAGGGRTLAVTAVPAAVQEVPISLEGLGSITAYYTVTVKTQVDGRLDTVAFKEGQEIKKGDLLAQIDPRPFAAQLHQAEGALARDSAQLMSAKLDLQRYATLVDQKLIPAQQFDQQKATVAADEGLMQIDEAAVETAKLNLSYARITSPIDGVTGIRNVDPGNIVKASDPNGFVLLTQLDPIALIFTLPEDNLPQVTAAIAAGEVPVEAYSRAGDTLLGRGTLALVDNQINTTTGTIRLKAILPNPSHALWPNQFVKARLLVATRKDALVVPAPAVQRGPQGAFVYIVGADQTVSVRPVDVDLTTDAFVIIRGGLKAGEIVVTEGQNMLRPGARVQTHPPAATGGASAAKGRP